MNNKSNNNNNKNKSKNYDSNNKKEANKNNLAHKSYSVIATLNPFSFFPSHLKTEKINNIEDNQRYNQKGGGARHPHNPPFSPSHLRTGNTTMTTTTTTMTTWKKNNIDITTINTNDYDNNINQSSSYNNNLKDKETNNVSHRSSSAIFWVQHQKQSTT